jgi:hypothetical protein
MMFYREMSQLQPPPPPSLNIYLMFLMDKIDMWGFLYIYEVYYKLENCLFKSTWTRLNAILIKFNINNFFKNNVN